MLGCFATPIHARLTRSNSTWTVNATALHFDMSQTWTDGQDEESDDKSSTSNNQVEWIRGWHFGSGECSTGSCEGTRVNNVSKQRQTHIQRWWRMQVTKNNELSVEYWDTDEDGTGLNIRCTPTFRPYPLRTVLRSQITGLCSFQTPSCGGRVNETRLFPELEWLYEFGGCKPPSCHVSTSMCICSNLIPQCVSGLNFHPLLDLHCTCVRSSSRK